MTTIHFATNWKNRAGMETGLCSKWAMRPRMSATTEKAEEVNCTRCAKSLGITPAAKEVPKNLGTCPCCFRSQKTIKGAKMVHHGYQRPGHGYIVGDCFGVKFPRYEDSCEGTIAYRDYLHGIQQRREAFLNRLTRNEVESLTHSYQEYRLDETGSVIRDRYGRRESKTVFVEVTRGAAAVGSPYARDINTYIPGFEELRTQQMQALKSELEALDAHVAELNKAIEAWKPAAS